MVRKTVILLILTLAISPLFAQQKNSASTPAAADPKPIAAELLRQGYDLGHGKPLENLAADKLAEMQTYFYVNLLYNSKDVLPPAQVLQWCKYTLELASQMPIEWNRDAQTKNSIVPCSSLYPEWAADTFLKVLRPPVPMDDGTFPESVFTDASNAIILNYWKAADQQDPWPKINAIIARMRETKNSYPYRASADIIVLLAKDKTSTGQIHDLALQTLAFYRREPYVYFNKNRDFAAFLYKVQGSIDSELFGQCISAFAKHVVAEEADPSKDPRFAVFRIGSDEGAQFVDNRQERGELTIYTLYRNLREQSYPDPALVKGWKLELRQAMFKLNPDLAPDLEISDLSAGAMNDPPKKISYLQAMARIYHQGTVESYEISEARKTKDPEKLLALAQTLKVRQKIIQARLAAAEMLAPADPERANAIFQEIYDSLPEPRGSFWRLLHHRNSAWYIDDYFGPKKLDKLAALERFAEISYLFPDNHKAYAERRDEVWQQAWKMALAELHQHPNKGLYYFPTAYNTLVKILQFSVSKGDFSLIETIKQTQPAGNQRDQDRIQRLRGFLLVTAAGMLTSRP